MHTLIAVILLMLAGPGDWQAASTGQQTPRIDEYKMTTYQAVFVKKGSGWGDVENPAIVRNQHRAYVADLVRTGRAVIGGQFAENPQLEAAYFVAGMREEASAIANAEPGVKHGWWDVEVLQWMGPEGWFQKPADVTQTEKIYFGFLVTGTNTEAISAEEQKQLMTGHLGHMDDQAKIGKLVLAGPLIKAAPRRGLIAYRVPTMAERSAPVWSR